MSENPVGCAKPTGAVIGEPATEHAEKKSDFERQESMVTARVGQKAPDFEAPAYLNGEFINIKLSDYKDKWVLICFYPGDFTFV